MKFFRRPGFTGLRLTPRRLAGFDGAERSVR
jgi:hypothetical protein